MPKKICDRENQMNTRDAPELDPKLKGEKFITVATRPDHDVEPAIEFWNSDYSFDDLLDMFPFYEERALAAIVKCHGVDAAMRLLSRMETEHGDARQLCQQKFDMTASLVETQFPKLKATPAEQEYHLIDLEDADDEWCDIEPVEKKMTWAEKLKASKPGSFARFSGSP